MKLDHYLFLDLAHRWSLKSRCLSWKVGALLVTPDGTQVGAGYNGPPRGIPHCDSEKRLRWFLENLTSELDPPFYYIEELWGTKCPRKLAGFESGKGLNFCLAHHAETNAIVNAARHGIETRGLVMYCTRPVCQECAKIIVNAGITHLFMVGYKGKFYDEGVRFILDYSNVEYDWITNWRPK